MKVPVRSTSALLAALLVGGCAAWRIPPVREKPPAVVTPPPETPAPQVVPPPPVVTPPRVGAPPPAAASRPAVPSSADDTYREGVAMMKEGKFERALECFADVWKEIPGYPGVEEKFPAALEGLKKSGDESQRQGRSGEAGKRWMAALKFLPHPAMKGKKLSFSKADLKEGVGNLSDNLMEKGLADYREGRLEEAIATWRNILAYDPAHEEANKSVKTATTQLENLKKLTPAAPGK
ncbi:MAG: hypothetical protein OEM42_01660 [Deltaproteobacteria bacterium]|nr:hypothetical protein [Deltaproteobacteria bacterium]MDH3382747.1 hypothetical protein [Deltaproteobacteria bacterium]